LKALVLGSTGQLGQCIKDAVKESKIEIVFFSRKDFDFLDLNNSLDKFDSIHPDIIVNAAAFTNVDLAEDQVLTANKVNNLGLEFLASKCKQLNSHLIHISTDYIFDGLTDSPYTEDSTPNPINIYGQTKYDGELRIQESGCKYTILRASWVFSEYGSNFLKTIMMLGKTKERLTVINDQVGSPTYAHDIAGIISEILFSSSINKYNQEIFNVCGHDQISWYDFSCKILSTAKSLGISVSAEVSPINSVEFNQNANRPKYSALSNLKISSRFKYKMTSLDAAILKSINYAN
tara:strand:- start:361 stop:1233 length:873 start_codon:yes stop_codon:yes gene_type:complete